MLVVSSDASFGGLDGVILGWSFVIISNIKIKVSAHCLPTFSKSVAGIFTPSGHKKTADIPNERCRQKGLSARPAVPYAET